MKNVTLLTFIFVIFTQIVISQTPTPTPTPLPIEVDNDVVKISTNLIQVDVTVTDKKGKIVKDLKAEDFEIYENGKKQKITGISFVSSQRQTEINDKKESSEVTIEAPPPAKEIKPTDVRRTIAIVVDDLSLSFESIHYVRRALRNFVEKQMQDGDLVAIVRTGSGIGALQQFTSDKRRLYAAIKKIKWNLRGAGGVSVFKPFSVHGAFDTTVKTGASEGNSDVPISEANMEDTRKSLFAAGSLGAMKYVVDGMGNLPGRKSVILFSDGFQIFSRGESKFTSSPRVLDSLTELVESANRAAVVFYTMDPRGIQPLNTTAADDFGSKPIGGISPVQKLSNSVASQRRTAFFTSQDGINYLAKETGGFAIYNTNDLSGGIRKILNDQSYYLIAYEPEAETFDPSTRRFNKLDVKVLKEDVKVRYRSGFFNVSDEKFKKPVENFTKDEKLLNALVSPFAVNDINVSLSTIFKGNEKDALFVNSYLYIDAKDLKFTETKDGKNRAVFDVFVANFGDNGVPTDQISKTFTLNVKGETYKKIINDGFVYYFALPIKKSGAYQMRVAIRDHANDKVGSASQFIEVPKLKKNRLTLSGIALENISYNEWNSTLNSSQSRLPVSETSAGNTSTAMRDTALRQFKRGTVLRYGIEVYNAKTNSQTSPQLEMRTRLFRGNKMIHEGKNTPILSGQNATSAVKQASGAINIGTNMVLGDYILQIIVIDKLAKKKRQIATQFVQFEIVE